MAGSWRCVDGDDPAFARPDFDDTSWAPLQLPDGSGDRVCGADVSWLRRRVLIDRNLRAESIGFAPGVIDGAYEVYADGINLGGRGDFAERRGALHEGGAFTVPSRLTDDGEIVFAIRIGNNPTLFAADPARRLVPLGPMLVGRMPSVDIISRSEASAAVQRRFQGFFALALVFTFISFYHVLLWFLRRDLLGYLTFGIASACVTIWLGITELRSTIYLPVDAVTAGVVGNFFGTMVNAIFIDFFWRFVPRTKPPLPWRLYQLALVVVAFIGFVPEYGLWLSVSPPVILLKVAMPISALVLLLRWGLKGRREAWVILVAIVVGAIAAPIQVLFLARGIRPPVNPAEVAFLFFMVVMAVALARQFTSTLTAVDAKNVELRETNASIARFVPFGFLEALEKRSVVEVQRGDARSREMAVMFCDVRGFTTLAESLGPDQTFKFINHYLSRMEPEIYRGAGFINQYLGDGIMALFPSHEGGQSGADGAVVAAIGMCRALEKLNLERKQAGDVPVKIGIGVHTGPLMIGTIGGGEQIDGGVVGDCVNASARLEGMTKMYGSQVLISGDVIARLNGAQPTLRHLDTVLAKGKTTPMTIAEILDVEPERAQKEATLARFLEAQRRYRQGEFEAAGRAFEAILEEHPGDGAARLLRERCHQLHTYPPEGWDGVYALTGK